MSAPASGLYVGRVAHDRVRPRRHRLDYRVFMLLLDLDELEGLDRRLRWFSHNRLNLLSFHDQDQSGRVAAPVKPRILARLAEQGLDLTGGRVAVLAMPRVLGHGFSPLSVYFCHDRHGALAAIVYGVRNTFGQAHDYVLAAPPEADGTVVQACDKTFRVSPFLPMAMRYVFRVTGPGATVRIAIAAADADGPVLTASFVGARRPLTDAALLRACLTHPWQIVGVLAAIHWEALKMLLKGAAPRPSPDAEEPPPSAVS